MAMKLSTGKVAFPIEFDNGDKDCIYFNPNDPDLMLRMKNFDKKVEDKINEFDNIELNEYGTPTQDSQIEMFEKMQNVLKDELDVAFGGEVSAVVFKHCSPFAFIGDEYFVVQFLNAILPEIEKHIIKGNDKINKYIEKYSK